MLIIMDINTYLDRVINPKVEQMPAANGQKQSKLRWVYSKNEVTLIRNPNFFQKQKLEKVLSILNQDLEQFENTILQDEAKDKLNTLKTLITDNVNNYKESHSGIFGKIYQAFSRLRYGDINKLKREVLTKIENLKKLIPPNLVEEDELQEPEKAEGVPNNILDFPIQNELNQAVLVQAKKIIEIFNKGTKLLIEKGIDFDTAQQLQTAKKEAKEILKDPSISSDTQKAMDEILKQYDNIVKEVEYCTSIR